MPDDCRCHTEIQQMLGLIIKVLIALVGQLSLSVGWEDGLERVCKTVLNFL